MSDPSLRKLTNYEKLVIERLLKESFPGHDAVANQIEGALVRELDEHGCLEFQVNTDELASVKHRIPVEGEFEDVDGIAVHFLLHVVDGKVNELEIYKDDGSRIIQLPDPSTLRTFVPE